MDTKYIISIAVTIAGVLLPVYIAPRWLNTDLFFMQESSINLYNSIVKSFSDLKMSYKGENITEGMFLLEAFIHYSGRKTITRDKAHKGIIVELDDKEGTWCECKIIKSSPHFDATLEIGSPNTLKFNFDLMKNGDSVYFKALSKAKKNSYKIYDRTDEVLKIKRFTVEYFKNIETLLTGILIIILVFIFVLLDSIRPDKSNFDKKFLNQKNQPTLIDTIERNQKLRLMALSNTYLDSVRSSYMLFDRDTKTYDLENGFKIHFYKRTSQLISFLYCLDIIVYLIFFLKVLTDKYRKEKVYKVFKNLVNTPSE